MNKINHFFLFLAVNSMLKQISVILSAMKKTSYFFNSDEYELYFSL